MTTHMGIPQQRLVWPPAQGCHGGAKLNCVHRDAEQSPVLLPTRGAVAECSVAAYVLTHGRA